MAEVVRGGLQAIPRGQYEAAAALGLGYWKSMGFIILPQALKHVIPGIVNNFISLFKDTSLVSIVGMFDLLNAVQTASTRHRLGRRPPRRSPATSLPPSSSGSSVSPCPATRIYMERRLNTGHKR